MVTIESYLFNEMVLQKEAELVVWGKLKTEAAVEVYLKLADNLYPSINEGKQWKISIPAQKKRLNVPFCLFTKEKVLSEGLLHFGTVYLFAGQSNMEFPLEKDLNYHNELSLASAYPRSYLQLLDKTALDGEMKFNETVMQAVKGHDIGQLSAVAFYALKQMEDLEEAVGVIEVTKGGTSIASWISEKALCQKKAAQEIYWTPWQSQLASVAAIADFRRANLKYLKQREELLSKEPNLKKLEIIQTIGKMSWPPPKFKESVYYPNRIWENCLKQLQGHKFSAVIWYQGEEDAKHWPLYEGLLTSLIFEWRELFQQNQLRFLLIQLPRYHFGLGDTWAKQRLVQAKVARQLPNVSLVTAIDQGEIDEIHPPTKKLLGNRVADCLLNNEFIAENFPNIREVKQQENQLIINFSGVESWQFNPDENYLYGSNQKGIITPLTVEFKGSQIVVRLPNEIQEVSYGNVDFPLQLLFNEKQLPLAPFSLSVSKGRNDN